MSVVVACGYCWAEAAWPAPVAHACDCPRPPQQRPARDEECQAATVGFCDCPRHAEPRKATKAAELAAQMDPLW